MKLAIMGNPLRGYGTSSSNYSFTRESFVLFGFKNCLTVEFLLGYSGSIRKPNEAMRLVVTTFIGVVFGFFLGVSFPTLSLTKVCNVSSYGSNSHSFGFQQCKLE